MITFVGDVVLYNKELKSDYIPKNPYIFNLEYVASDNVDDLNPTPNKINLASSNSNFEEIFGSNPVAVNMVNNHIYDYGECGFERTLKKMEQKRIATLTDEPKMVNDNLCVFS